MRVLHYNLSDPLQHCPNDFKLHVTDGQRLCGRKSGGCESVYPTETGYTYSRVCGRIVGYKTGSADGFKRYNCPDCSVNVNKAYLDGFSITYGDSSFRKHLYSYVPDPSNAPTCPDDAPTFVGPNYTCDTAPAGNGGPFFSEEPFCVELPEPTTESLELRACADEAPGNEDLLLQFAELYVQQTF